MNKKKVTVKVAPGQAVFVADLNVLDHIKSTYIYMSQNCEDSNEANSWVQITKDIDEWIEKTYVPEQGNYEEEW